MKSSVMGRAEENRGMKKDLGGKGEDETEDATLTQMEEAIDAESASIKTG